MEVAVSDERRCETCDAFQPMGSDVVGGQCRRRPPVVLHGEWTSPKGAWPTVERNNWCLEWQGTYGLPPKVRE